MEQITRIPYDSPENIAAYIRFELGGEDFVNITGASQFNTLTNGLEFQLPLPAPVASVKIITHDFNTGVYEVIAFDVEKNIVGRRTVDGDEIEDAFIDLAYELGLLD